MPPSARKVRWKKKEVLKVCKRITAFLLSLLLLLTSLPVAYAAEEAEESQPLVIKYTVSDVESFLSLAEKCRLDSYSENLRVVLRTNIDLTGTGFSGIPTFSGTFEGNGYTIKGLSITKEGSNQGLFRYLTDTAVVRDLTVIGTVQPGGSCSRVGGIAGRNAGQILNCSVTGSVSGSEYIGGIAGINEISGVIDNCKVNGRVFGSHFVGGIVGENKGVVRESSNDAKINDTSAQNTVDLSEITLDTITGSEAVNAVTDIGGISGISSGVIRNCVNNADIGYQHMGYNIGGIAGTQSGSLIDCKNYGYVRGRKEVGGIVGQLEPTALISYEEDALQILQKQVEAMGGTIGATVSNVQGIGDQIATQVEDLKNHIDDAQDAVDSLVPDIENPELPDEDTIQAAKNAISSSISGMTDTLRGMQNTAYSSMGALSTNLHTMQSQLNAIRNTLGNVSETIGGSITDVSDKDTDLNLMGKVSGCTNMGNILADRNAGGIAGAIAMENDLDPEEDWTILGNNSLNFESELRAVIADSGNLGQITCKKQNAGGIVGWQSMGLVRACINTGDIAADSAEYIGGISGQSLGFIRGNVVKCAISGAAYMGGVAGAASVVSDCRSVVKQHGGTEKIGEILGELTQSFTEVDQPVSGNFYFSVGEDIGAIDGISYSGQAEPLSRDAFLALENVPESFSTVKLRFFYPGGQERTFDVTLGESFPTSYIPLIPPKQGADAFWAGVEADTFDRVLFDREFYVEYREKRTVLESDAQDGIRPVMLAEGCFENLAVLKTTPAQKTVDLEAGETLIECWDVSITGVENLTALRIRIPEGMQEERLSLLICTTEESWHKADTSVHGSYLTAGIQESNFSVALVGSESRAGVWYAALCVAVVLTLILAKRNQKKNQKK